MGVGENTGRGKRRLSGKRGQRGPGLPAGVGVGHCEWGLWLDCGRAGVTGSDALTWARSLGVCSLGPRPHTARRLQPRLCSPGRGRIFFPFKNNIKWLL